MLPLRTVRHAEFLHNEVPGIEIPETIRDRMRGAGGDSWKEGLAIADELAAELRVVASGLYLILALSGVLLIGNRGPNTESVSWQVVFTG